MTQLVYSDSWLQFIYGDAITGMARGHKPGQKLRPIPYHSHDLSATNLIFPPNQSQNSSSMTRINETNVEVTEEANVDDVSNESHVTFNRGSHQNLVELDPPLETNGPTHASSTSDSSLLRNVVSLVFNALKSKITLI